MCHIDIYKFMLHLCFILCCLNIYAYPIYGNNVYSCITHLFIEHAIYLVTQLTSNSNTMPLLESNRFLHHDGKTIIDVNNNEEGRSLYNWYLSNYGNRYNKRKFVEGVLYTRIFMYFADVIQPKPGCNIELKVLISDTGKSTSLYIICDVNITNSYPTSLNKLGMILMNEKPNTY